MKEADRRAKAWLEQEVRELRAVMAKPVTEGMKSTLENGVNGPWPRYWGQDIVGPTWVAASCRQLRSCRKQASGGDLRHQAGVLQHGDVIHRSCPVAASDLPGSRVTVMFGPSGACEVLRDQWTQPRTWQRPGPWRGFTFLKMKPTIAWDHVEQYINHRVVRNRLMVPPI